jgi:hypothetical protein
MVKGKTNEKGEKCVSRVNTGRGENDIIYHFRGGSMEHYFLALFFLNFIQKSDRTCIK